MRARELHILVRCLEDLELERALVKAQREFHSSYDNIQDSRTLAAARRLTAAGLRVAFVSGRCMLRSDGFLTFCCLGTAVLAAAIVSRESPPTLAATPPTPPTPPTYKFFPHATTTPSFRFVLSSIQTQVPTPLFSSTAHSFLFSPPPTPLRTSTSTFHSSSSSSSPSFFLVVVGVVAGVGLGLLVGRSCG